MDVEAETKKHSPQTRYDDGQTPQTGEEKEDVPMQYPQPDKAEPESLEVVSPEQQGEEQKNPLKIENRGTEEQGTEEDMDTSEEYVDLVPSKPLSHFPLTRAKFPTHMLSKLFNWYLITLLDQKEQCA